MLDAYVHGLMNDSPRMHNKNELKEFGAITIYFLKIILLLIEIYVFHAVAAAAAAVVIWKHTRTHSQWQTASKWIGKENSLTEANRTNNNDKNSNSNNHKNDEFLDVWFAQGGVSLIS